jgi:coenzyme F420 hydrogenase subunit beta
MSVSINDVLKKNMCSGCGLCVKNKIDMQISQDGFARPISIVDDDISKYCPGIAVINESEEPYDNLWGPIVNAYAGYSLNEKIRFQGSSGGVITALATYLLETKKVDGIVQVGVSKDSPIENEVFLVTDSQDLLRNSGSRYAPSSPLSIVRELLKDEKVYGVIGKPCDIAAMRSLVKGEGYESKFPYLLSFMCAGVPSKKGTLEVLEKLGMTEEEVLSFKYRGDGWPGLTKAQNASGKVSTMTYNESWGTVLNKHLQARCKVCVDGIGESADVVCGDAWHETENGYPSFEESLGRSLTLSRSKVGDKLLQEAVADGVISLREYDVREIDKIQPFQKNRKQTLLMRMLAIKMLGGSTPHYKGYALFKNMMQAGFVANCKALTGTVIRKIKGRI